MELNQDHVQWQFLVLAVLKLWVLHHSGSLVEIQEFDLRQISNTVFKALNYTFDHMKKHTFCYITQILSTINVYLDK